MVGIRDIVPITETVKVGDQEMLVFGVSIEGIVSLAVRFPEVQSILDGDSENVDAKRVLAMAPKTVAAIIAAGCGASGDPVAEEIASKLSAEVQYDVLVAIGRLTMPGGVGPFVERVMNLKSFIAGFTNQVPTDGNAPETPSPIASPS